MAQEKKSLEQRIKEQLTDDQELVPEEVSHLTIEYFGMGNRSTKMSKPQPKWSRDIWIDQ